jgi:hypothetical protein
MLFQVVSTIANLQMIVSEQRCHPRTAFPNLFYLYPLCLYLFCLCCHPERSEGPRRYQPTPTLRTFLPRPGAHISILRWGPSSAAQTALPRAHQHTPPQPTTANLHLLESEQKCHPERALAAPSREPQSKDLRLARPKSSNFACQAPNQQNPASIQHNRVA